MIDLAKAKLHCRVDHDDEDTLIQAYIDAANEQIQAHLDRKVITTEAERLNENDLIDNKALDAARLLFVAHLYANREKAKEQAVEVAGLSEEIKKLLGTNKEAMLKNTSLNAMIGAGADPTAPILEMVLLLKCWMVEHHGFVGH